jgi:F0F1-type ATP synthase assembly protein I
VAIAIGFFWGRWLDRTLGTWPYLTAIFSLFGIIAGFLNLFRITAKAARDEEELAAENGRAAEGSDDGDGGDERC